MSGRRWTREELEQVLSLYHSTAFGTLHQRNPDVMALAERLNRTPSAVAMKACNFASLDPALQARGITGLTGASFLDRAIWNGANSARVPQD